MTAGLSFGLFNASSPSMDPIPVWSTPNSAGNITVIKIITATISANSIDLNKLAFDGIDELTSFSLPEGRSPAQDDLWIFVGFDGNEGRPTLKQLNVIGRESGRELVKIGSSQTVAVGVEDEAVENEFDRGNTELRDSIIVSANDIITKGDAIADPYEFLVPNTSCASCHRLNTLRFDFHSLSGFEDQGISVSPRVEGDVRRELIWSRTLMRR